MPPCAMAGDRSINGAVMEIRVLGPVELRDATKQFDIGSARERCVLAILALTPRVPVQAEALISRVWDSAPPSKAREDLSSYITRIRGRLRQAAGDAATVVSRSGAYMIDIDPEAVDLHLFRLRQRQARAMADSGDNEQAASLLREADALWRGTALAGLPGDWFAGMRYSLEEERRTAVLKRVELELGLGRHADLLSDLRSMAAQFGLDETVISYQMTALYRSGRAAEALRTYRDARASLTDQGIEPSAGLDALHQQILRRDPLLSITPAHRRPSRTGQPNNLPAEPSWFVGRAEEITFLTRDLQPAIAPEIAVIEGMPGVGKTTLAMRTARSVTGQFPDAQLYLTFRAHEGGQDPLDPAAALHFLLRALDIPPARIPITLEERAALWRRELAGRRAVIILDDVPGPEQVRPLLPAAGSCLILITTRRRLHGLRPTRAMSLKGLPLADAISLFSQVAGPINGDEAAIIEAIRLCGSLPLAICMAASRLRHGDPPTLPELVDALTASTGWPDRATTMNPQVASAFELSYRALPKTEQHLFRLLGSHPCPEITLHAAAALAKISPADATIRLTVLADCHLLEERGPGLYGFHDLLRGYAHSRAIADDPEPTRRQAIGRVLDYYLHTADRADRILYPHRRRMTISVGQSLAAAPAVDTTAQAQAWLESERVNMVASIRHSAAHERQQHCASLAHVLAGFLETNGHWDEAITMHELALQAARYLGDPALTAQAELELSHVTQQTGRYETAAAHAEHASGIYHSLGDTRGEAEALDRLGTIHDFATRFQDALAHYDEARSLYDDAGDQHGIADTLGHAGIAYACLGRYPEAISHLRESLARYRHARDRRGEAKILNNIGEIQRSRGYHRDAITLYQESLHIFEEIGGRQNKALLDHNMGIIHHYKGHYDDALASYRTALATYRATGDLRNQAGVLNDIGTTYLSTGHRAEALAHHQKAMQIAEQIGDQSEIVIALKGTGDACQGDSKYAEAADHYDRALRLARETGDLYQEARIITGIAETTLHTKGSSAARIYLRQALSIFDRLKVPEAEEIRVRLHVLAALADDASATGH